MASIDDTVKSAGEKQDIKQKKKEKPHINKEQSMLEKAVNKVIDAGFIALAAKYYLTSSLLTFSGFFTADIIMKKKKGEKLGLGRLIKTAFDNAGDAATNGGAQEEMYRGIDAMPNKTFIQKITKTLMFNPVVASQYQLYYQLQQYIRKDIGYCKAIYGILNPIKGIEYAKDFYHTKLKGQYLGKVSEVFKKVFPIHFVSINYITKEVLPMIYMPIRMGIAAMNDVIFAMASKPDKKKAAYQN